MKPWLFYSEACLGHLTAGHPESPERLQGILKALDEYKLLQGSHLLEPRAADADFIARIHAPEYVQGFLNFCQGAGSGQRIDEDTVVSEGSYEAALRSAGSALHLVEALSSEQCDTGFTLTRPPGHHAMPGYLMGFCFFNNVALAALYAIEKLGLERVAILDWDAHHGNGTEYIFYRDPRVLFVSWHQDPNWPGTGRIGDIGEGPGLGTSLNIPLPVNSGELSFLKSYQQLVEPALQRFDPQLILVSAGYDAHHADILTQMGMTSTGFARLTESLMQTAEKMGQVKVGFVLEGGYHLEALAASAAATVHTLVHEGADTWKEVLAPPAVVDETALDALMEKIKEHHPLLGV